MYLDPQKMYRIDLKIYEPMGRDEFPFVAPIHMERPNKSKEGDMGLPLENVVLATGYHTLYIDMTPEELTRFYDWGHRHGSVIKILGSDDLGHVDLN